MHVVYYYAASCGVDGVGRAACARARLRHDTGNESRWCGTWRSLENVPVGSMCAVLYCLCCCGGSMTWMRVASVLCGGPEARPR